MSLVTKETVKDFNGVGLVFDPPYSHRHAGKEGRITPLAAGGVFAGQKHACRFYYVGGYGAFDILSEYDLQFLYRAEGDLKPEGSHAKPKMWKDMTPEEKGLILLGKHEGCMVQILGVDGETWSKAYYVHSVTPFFAEGRCYRVKPEPVRETVALFAAESSAGWVMYQDNAAREPFGTHRITFDTIDGEPDCSTVKMEKL